jgi:hypothetical protein
MKVRPRVGEVFARDERMGIYCKAYNLGADRENRRPSGQVSYQVLRKGSGERVVELTEDFAKLPEASSAAQITIQKFLSLRDLEPGQYTLRLKMVDRVRNQMLTPGVDFTVL